MENKEDVTPTTKANPTTGFITMLGEALLKEKQRDWMDMNEVVDFCNTQGILLYGKEPHADQLETALTEFFSLAGEFYAPGLVVAGYKRRVGWDSVFMVRVYPFSLTPPSTVQTFNEMTDFELRTACND